MSFSKNFAPSHPVSSNFAPAFCQRVSRLSGVFAMSAIALFVVAGSAIATEIIIDDFKTPSPPDDYVIDFLDPNPFLMKQAGGIGGERDLRVEVVGPVFAISATGTLGKDPLSDPILPGAYQFGSAGASGVTAALQYDGVDFGDTAAALSNAQGLNVDLTDSNQNFAIRLGFSSVNTAAASSMDVHFNVTSAGGTAEYIGTGLTGIQDNAGNSAYYVLMSDFTTTGAFSWAAVTSFQVSFNELAVKDIDFELNQISSVGFVPEPSTFVLAGCGAIAGLLAVRRRRAA